MRALFISFFIFSVFISSSILAVFAAESVINSTVKISVCGNGVIEGGEQCDGSNLAGLTCRDFGFQSGTLSCRADCSLNKSSCSGSATPPSGGGGGGGGGFAAPPSTGAEFFGRAYPGSRVTILKDGQVAASTVAGGDAVFKVSLSGVSPGKYNFGVYSEDKNGVKSLTTSYPVTLTEGSIATISGVFIAPTVTVDKAEVKKGDNINIFGQSSPGSEVTVKINSEEEFFERVVADKGGVYNLIFDTSLLEIGAHSARSKTTAFGTVTEFGVPVRFAVGSKTVMKKVGDETGDLNNDGRVNIVDFSVAAYWYKRGSPPSQVDLNGDGRVTLVDFSILAFNWTG